MLDKLLLTIRTGLTEAQVCVSVRTCRGLPCHVVWYLEQLRGKSSVFQTKNGVCVQVWRGKREVRMMTIKSINTVNTTKIKGTWVCLQIIFTLLEYSKFMKGVDRPGQYVSELWNGERWRNPDICALFHSFCSYTNLICTAKRTRQEACWKTYADELQNVIVDREVKLECLTMKWKVHVVT